MTRSSLRLEYRCSLPDVRLGLTRAFLILLLCPISVYGRAKPAVFAAAEVRKGLLTMERRIKSVRVEYRTQAAHTERASEGIPRGGYVYRIVAAKAPGEYYHVSAHGHNNLDWRDDPFQQRAFITLNHLYNEYPVNRAYFELSLSARERLPGSLQKELFFFATGIWPLTHRQAPKWQGQPYMLQEIAESEKYSIIRPCQERIDGRWCHMLEYEGVDVLWIDVGRSCLMARETYDPQRRTLMCRFELSSHREVAPGIWLPERIRNIQYDFNAPSARGRNRKVIDARIAILDMSVNDVDDQVFRFKPSPGSLRIDSGEGDVAPEQSVPGGQDHLDKLTDWIEKYAPPQTTSSPTKALRSGGIALVLAIVACELWLRLHVPRGPKAN